MNVVKRADESASAAIKRAACETTSREGQKTDTTA